MSSFYSFQLILLCILLGSCSFLSKSPDLKSKSYTLQEAPRGWRVLAPGGSDHAFSNEKSFSIITINSLCGRYESTNLRQLTFNMLGGLDEPIIEHSTTVQYNNREALRSDATARIDGVPVFLTVKILRKNECIYDIVLISTSNEARESDTAAYNKLLTHIIIP
jgi:hypothetical protein